MSDKNEQKSMLEMLSPKQNFMVGVIGGVLVLCTVGFFVLLGVMFKGGVSWSNGDNDSSTDISISEVAEVPGPATFSSCLSSGKYASVVSQDQQLGGSLGVNGTPSTFINGYNISGALPYAVLQDIIDDILAGRDVFIDDYTKYGMETGTPEKATMPELPNVVWKGGADAKVSIVEFSDFECPYCNRFAPTMGQVLAAYGDKVKFTYRHFPLTSIHPNAQKAAEAFECAKEQGKAFEMHDKLFELSRTETMSISAYGKAATDLGLK